MIIKRIADLEKSTAEAQKRAAETSGAGAGGGSVPPVSTGGGGGAENGIRYFQSLKELTDYLDGLSMGELRGVSSEIQKIFESLNGLDPEAKNISALFDNDNTLRALALSAVSKKFGSAEIASMQYGSYIEDQILGGTGYVFLCSANAEGDFHQPRNLYQVFDDEYDPVKAGQIILSKIDNDIRKCKEKAMELAFMDIMK